MKQFICLLILLIGVLNTHGTPISIGIGGGGSLNPGLQNLPSSIDAIVNGSGSSNSSDASVPADVPESSSRPAESVTTEATEASSVTTESSEATTPVDASEATSAATEPESTSVSAATTETAVPPEPTETSSASSSPAETSPSSASLSTETSAPSESTGTTVEETSEPENSTNSPVSESTEPTTPESENPNTCLGSCPAVDSYDSVYLVNERCDKFCQCSNGRAIVLSCPEGLHFNRVLNVCDWPINAKCARLAVLN